MRRGHWGLAGRSGWTADVGRSGRIVDRDAAGSRQGPSGSPPPQQEARAAERDQASPYPIQEEFVFVVLRWWERTGPSSVPGGCGKQHVLDRHRSQPGAPTSGGPFGSFCCCDCPGSFLRRPASGRYNGRSHRKTFPLSFQLFSPDFNFYLLGESKVGQELDVAQEPDAREPNGHGG